MKLIPYLCLHKPLKIEIHFQFSIFNFQWLRAARKPGRMLGKSVGIKLFH